MYACMYVCMHACMFVISMYVCMYVCMYACMYVCMHIWQETSDEKGSPLETKLYIRKGGARKMTTSSNKQLEEQIKAVPGVRYASVSRSL